MDFTIQGGPMFVSTKKKILPVVHVDTLDQTLRNVELTLEAEADGIFLICHDDKYPFLMTVYREVRDKFPDAFIGLNFLDLTPRDAFLLVESEAVDASALWVDNVGVFDCKITAEAEDLAIRMQDSSWSGLYFGGTSFKHQQDSTLPAVAASLAKALCHVVTTSGASTGLSADTRKLATMKRFTRDHPLATASGFSIENAAEQLPHLDAVLVASSICKPGDFYNFDPHKLRELVQFTHEFTE